MQIEALEKARKIQGLIEIDMEDEEVEIRKLMFLKNLKLILAEQIKINVDQFKALQTEFKQVLKHELDTEKADEFKEFMNQVNMCLKLLQKCPTKDLLDNEVKEKVEELCPQVNFEQLFTDRAAQLFHMAQKNTGPFGCIDDNQGSDESEGEEGEAEMSEGSQSASNSAGSQVSKSGKDSRNVSSSDSDSGSSSSSNDSSSDDESSEESKQKGAKVGEQSSSSGESEEVMKKPVVTPSKKPTKAAASESMVIDKE